MVAKLFKDAYANAYENRLLGVHQGGGSENV